MRQNRHPYSWHILLLIILLGITTPGWGADAKRGKRLFEEPGLGGSTNGKSCITCHEHGRDLSPETLTRPTYTIMGNQVKSLAEVVNFCIEVALRGEALDEKGPDMADLLAYLRIFAIQSRQNGTETNGK